jgi:hypothetical protein
MSVSREPSPTGPVAEAIGHAVSAWLDGLDAAQRASASFPFETPERFVWAYTPGTREGLAIGEMAPGQQAAAMAVVAASMSDRGAAEVEAVIALERVLGALEHASGRPGWQRRDPGLYWFAVFGDPAGGSPWSWRIGGHHVAIHLTMADGQVVGSAPSFLGANPATVPDGPAAGSRALTGEEDLARRLLAGLSASERRGAILDETAPADILSGNGPRARVDDVPTGIRFDELDRRGRAALEALVRHYLGRSRPEVADAEWQRIAAAGLGAVSFAWAGSELPGHGHYYAVRGPRFLIEYDNTQDGANHVHAVWRDLDNDWGEDLLATHLATHHAETRPTPGR